MTRPPRAASAVSATASFDAGALRHFGGSFYARFCFLTVLPLFVILVLFGPLRVMLIARFFVMKTAEKKDELGLILIEDVEGSAARLAPAVLGKVD